MIRVDFVVVGPLSTNCYLLINEETKETVIIDPGADAKKIAACIGERDLKPTAILLTHGHFDHMTAAEALRQHYEIPVYACEKEKKLLQDASLNLAKMFFGKNIFMEADVYCKEGDHLALAGCDIQVIETPGHTEGGCCYYLASENKMFTGDTLFCGGIGRTDFPGGSYRALCASIREKLYPLPKETICYTGHGESTAIGYEKEHNPYVR